MTKLNRAVSRRISLLLVVLMLFTQPVWAFSNLDSSHWAYDSMIELAKDRVFAPVGTDWSLDQPMTRSAFVRLVNGAYGFSEMGNADFSDVSMSSAYYNDIAKAVAAGYINGYPDGTFKPEGSITRQEAAAVLAKLTRKEEVMTSVVNAFSDGMNVPNWSKDSLAWMVQKSYMNGYPDGSLGYDKAVTYAEALTIVKNILGERVVTESVNGNGRMVKGNLSVLSSGITLSNLEVSGDLMISGQVGNGDVTLDNVTVNGRLIVYGGGENSIHLFNTVVSQLVVSRFDAPVRIVADANSQVRDAVVETSSILEAPPSVPVFRSVIVQPAIVNMAIDLRGTFEDIAVSDIQSQLAAAGVDSALPVKINIPLGSVIKTLRVAAQAEIAGSGQVENADVQVNDIKINVKTNSFKLGNNVSKVVVNNKTVGSASEANSEGRKAGSGTGSTGGSSGGSTGGSSGGSTGGSSGGSSSSSKKRGNFQFSVTTATVQEGSDLELTIDRSNGSFGSITVTYEVENGTTTDADLNLSSTLTTTFSNNETSKTITIPTVDDTTVEGDETFTVKITDVGSASIGSNQSVAVTLTDNDTTTTTTPSTIQFATGSVTTSVNEGSTATLTVERSGNTAASATVVFTVAAGSTNPASSSDYTVQTSSPLSFAAGETSKTITVATTDDTTDENNETFAVTLSSPSGNGELGTNTTSTVTITDDDTDPSTIQFAAGSVTTSVNEGSSATLTVERTGNTAVSATVVFTVAAGSTNPASSSDYTAQTSSPLSFAAGETSKTITVETTDDTTDENNETFVVTLSNPGGNGELGTNTTSTVTITDDDTTTTTTPSTIQFATGSVTTSVNEGSPATLTVERTGNTAVSATVVFTVAAGSTNPASSSDYTAQTSSPLSFAAGETSKTITVETTDDTTDENNETFVVTLSNPGGNGELGTNTTSTVTITDDDTTPTLTISSTSYTSTTPAALTVTFSDSITSSVTTPGSVEITSGASLILDGSTITTTSAAFEITSISRNSSNNALMDLEFSRAAVQGMEMTFKSAITALNTSAALNQVIYIFNGTDWVLKP